MRPAASASAPTASIRYVDQELERLAVASAPGGEAYDLSDGHVGLRGPEASRALRALLSAPGVRVIEENPRNRRVAVVAVLKILGREEK